MKTQDALRKVELLRRIKTENGASASEAQSAARLAKALVERYAIKAGVIPTASRGPSAPLTWIDWQELLNEFGLRLDHFGRRGKAVIGGDTIVYISLGTAQWWIEQRSNGRWHTNTRELGVNSLRKYLNEHIRRYSFFR